MIPSFESRPMVRPTPDRHYSGKPNRTIGRETFVSLTYLNGC